MVLRVFALDDIINPRTGEVLFAKGDPLGAKEFDDIALAGIVFVPTLSVLLSYVEYSDKEIQQIILDRY